LQLDQVGKGSHTIGHPMVAAGTGKGAAVLAETVVTFALAHTVLSTATTSFSKGKSYYGLAIGFTVLSGAISVGGVSGGAFNPAVAMTTILTQHAGQVWVFLLGPLLGGALAGGLFRLTHPAEVVKDPLPPKPVYTDFVIEFVGTFLLSFTVGCAARNGGSVLTPLSIGSMLMSQVYAGGPTSGGHYNPAVTIACYVRLTVFGGKDGLPALKAAGYILVQLLAGLVAGGVARAVVGDIGFPAVGATYGYGSAWLGEFVATFFLAFVVLQAATAPATADNSFFGLAIGFTVTAMAVAIGGISGGALNPAVAMLGVTGGFNSSASAPWASIFGIYWTACPLGGLTASLVYRFTNFTEFESEEPNEATKLKNSAA